MRLRNARLNHAGKKRRHGMQTQGQILCDVMLAAAERDAWRRGLEDVHAWLPPPIAGRFGRRLERLGWVRDDAWTPYCKKLAGP